MRKCKTLFALTMLLSLPMMAGAQEVYTDNVVIVLDASGSMTMRMSDAGGRSVSRMQAAKDALIQVLSRLPETTNVGLLVFGGVGIADHWVYPLSPRDDAKLNAAIRRIEPQGGTPLGRYIKIAADRLLEERQKQHNYGSYRLLIVTDGEAGDQQLVDQYTPEVISRGITIDVIGVGMTSRHTLATRVHTYRAANDPAALAKALREVFAEVGGTASDDYAQTFDELASLPDGVAVAMLTAFSTTGNEPIGMTPRAPATHASAPAAHTHRNMPTPGGRSTSSEGTTFVIVLIAFFGVVATLKIVQVLFKSTPPNRRR